MSTDGRTIITDAGEAAIQAAIASSDLVAITHVAIGDGAGAPYDPPHAATSLRGERARVAITSQSQSDEAVWLVRAAFPEATTPDFTIRELGFVAADGTLVALWAGTGIVARQTHGLDVLVDHTLALARVGQGVIIVDAPEDGLLHLAAAVGGAIAQMQREQLLQADRITTLETIR